jgi:hypothetical protein
MARWILICVKCKSEFRHSQISDLVMARLRPPVKPAFEETGNECVCPNCGYPAIYFRANLLYRADITPNR